MIPRLTATTCPSIAVTTTSGCGALLGDRVEITGTANLALRLVERRSRVTDHELALARFLVFLPLAEAVRIDVEFAGHRLRAVDHHARQNRLAAIAGLRAENRSPAAHGLAFLVLGHRLQSLGTVAKRTAFVDVRRQLLVRERERRDLPASLDQRALQRIDVVGQLVRQFIALRLGQLFEPLLSCAVRLGGSRVRAVSLDRRLLFLHL